MTSAITKRVEDYRVAWISALPIERSSAWEMLDETHDEPADFNRNLTDDNYYDWGKIHGHNIVITSLPATGDGTGYGKVNAAYCVTELLASLPQIKFGLLVGIGGGLPTEQNDIRLGDVVVSQPQGLHGGVIQYDLGKAENGVWLQKGFLNAPPPVLLKALAALKARHESGCFRLVEFLDKAMKRNKYWGDRYSYPAHEPDRLFTARGELIRLSRSEKDPQIHFGTIASGDTLVKDEIARDAIPEKVKQTCLCVEMEAAGLMNKFPCIVIRGICDYADTHKNDHWQRYASATAAAFAKELLLYAPASEVQKSQCAVECITSQAAIKFLTNKFDRVENESRRRKIDQLLQDLYTCPYVERKDTNVEAVNGTCQWFTKHKRFVDFTKNPAAKLLWVSADPGCGKSVLSKFLVDKFLSMDMGNTVCYFFFKDDFLDQNRCTQAISAVLRQLVLANRQALKEDILEKRGSDGKRYLELFADLWQAFLDTAANSTLESIICVFDALDECKTEDRRILIKAISHWYRGQSTSNLKILVTSRPYYDIKDDFYDLVSSFPNIHLSGESEAEAREISNEIDIVLKHRIRLLCKKRSLTAKEEGILVDKFVSIPQRTYLWAHLTLDLVENTLGLTQSRIQKVLAHLPLNLEQAYERILNRSPDHQRTRIVLHILMAAQRPLSVEEVSIASSITAEQKNCNELDEVVEPAKRFKETVRGLCGLLVIIKDLRVYFLHQTVREFLLKKIDTLISSRVISDHASYKPSWCNSLWPSESHRVFAERCLWYLVITDSASCLKSFFDYCNHFWVLHCLEGELSMGVHHSAIAVTIFQYWSSSYRTLPWHIRQDHHLEENLPLDAIGPIPTIYFPSWFGMTTTLLEILERDPTIKDMARVMNRALYLTTLAGHVEAAKILLNSGAVTNIGWIDTKREDDFWDDDEWPLSAAISTSNQEILDVLLEHDIKAVNIADPSGFTLLHHAARGAFEGGSSPFTYRKTYGTCNVGIIQSLIKKQANREARCNFRMPIHMFLMHTGRDCANIETSRRILAMLLPSGTNWNDHDDLSGASLMNWAALNGCATCMQAMHEMGSSVHLKDSIGNNLLHHTAVSKIDRGGILFALSQGLHVDARNDLGMTALSLAALHHNEAHCKTLLRYRASIQMHDNMDKTPLSLALERFSESGEELLKVSPAVGTPMFHDEFKVKQAWGTLKLLVDSGADVNARCSDGKACIHHAVLEWDKETLEMLLKAGAKVDVTDDHGRTALVILAKYEEAEGNTNDLDDEEYDEEERFLKTRILLEYSADRSIVDGEGHTALWYVEETLRKINGPNRNVDSLMTLLVLLKYGLEVELDSLAGNEEFELYLKQAFGGKVKYAQDVNNELEWVI